ncbi:MAG TPA: inositol monophosphatase family protein, partial [Gemmatimonadales bacterium]|nr:inositol monophosphatase family protein [Gemmatimonadales bacterium]
MRDLKELVDVAREAAARAAQQIRSSVPPPASEWTVKNRNDFVTDVDRRAEALITEILVSRVPGSVVVGEELTPESEGRADVVWIVDPLDGTTNFLHGYAQYAVSIGARVAGHLAVGVVHDVPRDVVYHGSMGTGSWCGERRLKVSGVSDPSRALIGTGFPFKNQEEIPRFLEQLKVVLAGSSGVRRAGAAALDLADIAAGRLDGFWELSLAPWDVAAGAVLVRE